MTETEQARAHELLYSCDSREELCGRIAELEKLVRDMWHLLFDWLFKNHEVPWKELEAAHDCMRALGLEESK